MNIFGRKIFERKTLEPKTSQVTSSTSTQSIQNRTLSSVIGSWWGRIRESYAGAWQRRIEVDINEAAAYWAVFSCVTLIAGDISKCPAKVMEKTDDDIWEPTLMRPVLRKPNGFQTSIEFMFCWVVSKLLRGNTYVLKQRGSDGKVTAMYVLDPSRVTPLVSDDGSVFYQLQSDVLSGIGDQGLVVPAREIIHDRMYPLYHPLVGVSPIHACGTAAMQGIAIQNNSEAFFKNMSRPGGMLTAPGKIDNLTAERLKAAFEENFSGENVGRLAVAGDDLKYQAFTVSAEDAQLIQQLKMTAEMIAACFHVPGYKIGVGQMPTVNNAAQLNQQYYDQCLQYLIETMEYRLDDGLELVSPDGRMTGREVEVWFDLDNLVRMDPETRDRASGENVGKGWMKPNEARRKANLRPVEGGDTPYLQVQNYSLAALAKRDAQEDPFNPSKPAPSTDGEPEIVDQFKTLLNARSPESLDARY